MRGEGYEDEGVERRRIGRRKRFRSEKVYGTERGGSNDGKVNTSEILAG